MRSIACVLLCLMVAAPVHAETARRIGVTMNYVRIASDEPDLLSVTAFIEYSDVKGTSAHLVWWLNSEEDGKLTPGENVAIDPKSLVINSTLTKATLTLPDGYVLKWVAAPGEYSLSGSDGSGHQKGTTWRYDIDNEHHYGAVTGSFGDYAVDSGNYQQSSYFPAEVYIWRQIERQVTTTR